MSRLAIALAILAGTHGAVAAPDRAPFKVTYDAEHLERMRIVRAQLCTQSVQNVRASDAAS